MRSYPRTAFVNQFNYKNDTACFTNAFKRKAALNKGSLFSYFVLVLHLFITSAPLFYRRNQKSHLIILLSQSSCHAPSDSLGLGPLLGLGFITSVVQATTGYSVPPVLCSDRMGNQFGPCAGTGPSAEDYILCEQSVARASGKILGPREGGPGSSVLRKETSPLLLQFYRAGDDRPAYTQGPIEAGHGRKDGTMSSGTVRVRCPVQAPRYYQRPSLRRFCGRALLGR